MSIKYDFIIAGGGIVGLSTGMWLTKRFPDAKVLVLEKEGILASHQTGHNSGVIHSGIYYKPGSFKAKFAKAGSQSMTAFCEEHQINHDICSKVIVATNEEEMGYLDNLYNRGIENGLAIAKIKAEELREKEPHVNGLGAIHVPVAGIVDYKEVSERFAEIIQNGNGEIKVNTKVENVTETDDGAFVETNNQTFETKWFINCTGLFSDRVAKASGYLPDMKIIPFRGEYYKLKEDKRHLVKNLIYPVPNPKFPFLGVHFTRMVDGNVEVGPNAVLGFKREGYTKKDFNLKDLYEVLGYTGFWKLAKDYMREGIDETVRSFSKSLFVKDVQRLVPAIKEEDLIPAEAGVRAQALKSDGQLVDDFEIIVGKSSIHVCNAPSPAATASIEIGKYISSKIPHI
ncbi:L-2-hydroxyglutarate oxidase [Oceanobacillus halotolerans]|uniref:L-2-hydroxyglutarate oxidase n=1 Tax=Oceanobacillus halotolerans TaxID=2663380 RepID=UPI0013D90B0C|nr:L-2-hydroxyglutarate oxidase [Oceanobacillus halotolerans]